MRFQTRLKACLNLIDLTPLVDVIFLLLIFFIITSDILPLKSLSIENPELSSIDAPVKLAHLIVIMDKDQVIYIGSKKDIVDMGSVKEHLVRQMSAMKARHPESVPTVVLNVDKRVDYGAFLRLYAQVQECSPHIRLSFTTAGQYAEAG
jgi:biopolymer transport protein ExbD